MPASRPTPRNSPPRLAQLKAAGCERVFREKISGATADRPQLRQLLAVVAHGDVVIIPAVDRLSRDTTDLLVIARDLQKAGAGLRSIAEPVVDTTSDFAELVLAMLGVAAKLERRRIKERTALGRANAKDRRVKFGRKPKLTEHQRKEAIRAVFDHSESSLLGAKRRSNPGDRRSAAVALDCFASLAMTVAYRLDRKAL